MSSQKQNSKTALPAMLADWRRLAEEEISAQLAANESMPVRSLAAAIVDRISDDYGGQQIYIPFHFTRIGKAAREIYNDWSQFKPEELALRYKQSTAWVYRMYKKGRRLSILERQGDLFTVA
jgi:Mor family transcriptional regulator